jgi:hypothetical protein
VAGLTHHDVLVAVIGAVVGALIASIPVWITVAQIRRTRLKSEVNDAVNAKIGDLVGGAFTNLLRLQRDAETSFHTLRTNLEADAARVTATVQNELDGALANARKTMDDLQRIADRAKKSASEIDEVKESATALGIDLDKLAASGEERRARDDLEQSRRNRQRYWAFLETLAEQQRIPEEDRNQNEVQKIIRLVHDTDAEDAMARLALEIKDIDEAIEIFQSEYVRIEREAAEAAQMNVANARAANPK